MAKPNKAQIQAIDVAVPQSDAEADALIRRVGAASRQLQLIEQSMQAAIARHKQSAEDQAAGPKADLKAMVKALSVWGAANRARLTEGGRRQKAVLPSGAIAWRQRPPSVRIQNVATVLAEILRRGDRQFIRIKEEINKEAMLADPETARQVPGVSIGSAGETFTVIPAETGIEVAP